MDNECKYLIADDVSGPYDHPDYRYKCALGCDMLSPKITCRHCKIDEKSKILKSMYCHWDEATKLFNIDNIVMLGLQGSQNYGLETETSDVDTKLLVTPTMDDIIYLRQPKSHTHVLPNNEHLDYKDVRLYFDNIKKQNPNWLEILFTDYYCIGGNYLDLIEELVSKREEIGRSNPLATIQAVRGCMLNKIHCYKNPSTEKKIETIAKYGYDPKEFGAIMRFEYFVTSFLSGVPYSECLRPQGENLSLLKGYKAGELTLKEADLLVELTVKVTIKKCEDYIENNENQRIDPIINDFLNKIQKEIIVRSLKN